MSKRLGGILGCKYKISHYIETGSPMVLLVTLGQQYNTRAREQVEYRLLIGQRQVKSVPPPFPATFFGKFFMYRDSGFRV